jgi:predicted nucleic acid-binding protein
MFKNNDNVFKALSLVRYDRALVPLATDAEIRFGFENGNKTTENLKKYQQFIGDFNIEIIAPDQDTSIIYADLASWLRKHGKSLSNNDLWIAATCVQTGSRLATLDKDFSYLPQIRLINLK